MRQLCLHAIVEGETLKNRMRQYVSQSTEAYAGRVATAFATRLNRLRTLHGRTTEPSDALWEDRLVHNASSVTLGVHELSVLKKGLNFAVCPMVIPKTDFIASVESAIASCTPEDKAFVRKKASTALNQARIPKCNLSSDETKALKRLREEEAIIILPADKGKATVVLDRSTYQQKLRDLLDEGPYRSVQRDPGSRLRRELHRKLIPAVNDGRLSRVELLRLCPTHFQTPHLFGLPKVHKTGLPLRPIVSMKDSLLAPISRALAVIMRPFVLCDSYIKDSEDLVQHLSSRTLDDGEFASLDVESLFTNVPIPETLEVFERLLRDDSLLSERTIFTVEEIVDLSRFVLTSCYFMHFDGLFVQTDGVAMGSSLGPVAANVFMAHFEGLALREAAQRGFRTPSLWLRYVDDVLIHWGHSEDELHTFLRFINDLRPTIRFSSEREVNGELPFLDVLLRNSDGVLSFGIYRKPTHTDHYLHRTSAHPSSVFKGILRTLSIRAQRVCSGRQLQEEKRHLRRVFLRNGYNNMEISRGLRKIPCRRTLNPTGRRHPLPYLPGVSDRISRVLRDVGVLTSLKPVSTLRSLLVKKRPAPPRVLGSVYSIKCSNCPWRYVGETGRTLQERQKEHARAIKEMDVQRSEVARHAVEDGHEVEVSGMEVIDKESSWRRRVVKEALWTRKLKASNKVMHELGHAWKL